MSEAFTPEYLLQLFRQGKDTWDLAHLPEVIAAMPKMACDEREAEVVRLLACARAGVVSKWKIGA